MNGDSQDKIDEHPSLEEQRILSLDEFHLCGTFCIVVSHLVDASAHGKGTHDLGITGLQQLGNRTHILHPRIEPQIVRIGIKDDWHTIVDNSGHGIWRSGQNRAGFDEVATGVLPAIPNSCESEQLAFVDFETIWLLQFPGSLPLVKRVRGNQAPARFQ